MLPSDVPARNTCTIEAATGASPHAATSTHCSLSPSVATRGHRRCSGQPAQPNQRNHRDYPAMPHHETTPTYAKCTHTQSKNSNKDRSQPLTGEEEVVHPHDGCLLSSYDIHYRLWGFPVLLCSNCCGAMLLMVLGPLRVCDARTPRTNLAKKHDGNN